MMSRYTRAVRICAFVVGALVIGGMIGPALGQGVEFEFLGTVSSDISDPANYAGGAFPTRDDWVSFNTVVGILTNTPPVDPIRAIRVGNDAGSTGVMTVGSNGFWRVTEHTSWDSHIGASGTGTLNIQAGADLSLNFFEVGRNPGSLGTINVTGGILTGSRGSKKAGYSVHIGANDNTAVAGTGIVEISGGTFRCRSGLELGSPTGTGTGTFSVVGSGPDLIDIGNGTSSGNGKWDQYAGSTLKIAIDTNGVTPILINDTSDGTAAPAVFVEDSLLDVSFLDGHVETNFWTAMTAEGDMSNGGLKFAPGVDTNNWGFIVSNDFPFAEQNSLLVGYGLGWPAGGAVDKTPPPTGRSLYWTGDAGDTDPVNSTNWVTDTSGTPAEWGIYPNNDDVIYLGHADVTTNDFVSVMDYTGTENDDQGVLNLGYGRTGVLNHASGALRFSRSGISTVGQEAGGSAGNGTINLTGGDMQFNALRLGLGGSQGTLNIDGGTVSIGRAWNSASIHVGYSSTGTGTGTINITSGALVTRGEVRLGREGDPGIFCVEGTNATQISIGSGGTSVDGYWAQGPGSVLKIRIGEGHGVTPIEVVDAGDAGHYGNGDVFFETGAILDVAWMPGVTNYGSFDVMMFDGVVTNNGLQFADSVDDKTWAFAFVDSDGDLTNDTLRVSALKSLAIREIEPVGTDVRVTWADTAPGVMYSVESSMDLTASNSWADVPPFVDMVATGTSMSILVPVSNLTEDMESFRIRRALPQVYLEEDFEGDSATNWTSSGTGTMWELGEPTIDNGFVTITNSASPTNCWGTDLDNDTGIESGTDASLVSPPIEITETTVTLVQWSQAKDIDSFYDDDLVTVSVIDEDDGTTNVIYTLVNETAGSWFMRQGELPASTAGHTVRLQFRFQELGNNDPGFAGWFIDDVVVKEQ